MKTLMGKELKLETTVHANNRKYYIVSDGMNQFWSIEDRLIDENGILTENLNGISGLMDTDINKTISMTLATIEIDRRVALGENRRQATIDYMSRL